MYNAEGIVILKRTQTYEAAKQCISDDLMKLNGKQCQDLYCLILMILRIKTSPTTKRPHSPLSLHSGAEMNG